MADRPIKRAVNKLGDYSLVNGFGGYNARTDPTMLPPNILVPPSQNVVIGTSGRLALVKGYYLDGAASTVVDSGIRSNFDFYNFKSDLRNLRAGFMTVAANDGKLQFRYVNGSSVSWQDLMTGLTSINLCFTTFTDITEKLKVCLWVDGSTNIREWNGAVTTVASVTSNTITKAGTTTWAEEGFYTSANKKIMIGGVEYTYTGGESTTALTGVTPNPIISHIDQSQATQNGSVAVGEQDVTTKNYKLAQSFIAGQTNITGVKLFKIANTGTFTGDVTVYLLSDNAGVPGNTLATVTIANATYNALGAAEFDAIFGTPYNTAVVGTKYWIYIETSTADTSNHPNLGTNTAGGYSSGSVMFNNTTDGWTAIATIDLYFKTLYSVVATEIAFQSVVTIAMASITAIESTFLPTVIGNGKDNQVYLGMSTSNNQYISKVNNYKDYGFTATRVVGEGMLLRLKAPPVKYVPQESQESTQAYDMYISSGKNNWQVVRSTLSSDNTKEKIELIDLKIAPLQGAMSERLVTKMKNHIIFVGNDKVANFLGYMSTQFVPIMTDFSYPIIDDMNSYDFTDASTYYYKNYIYIAIPRHSLIRIYNMTNQTQENTRYQSESVNDQPWFWEAPVAYPISGFYEVDGELYGHNYTTSESYKLFTTGAFNGQDIAANATFAFDDKGDRTQSKGSNEIWVEGYIKQNTNLSVTVAGDLNSCQTSQTKIINGSDQVIVCYGDDSGAIGKNPLGSRPLGGTLTNSSTLPAWFRVSKTYPQIPFYLEQISFNTKGVDLQWELLCFGTNSKFTPEGNASITE